MKEFIIRKGANFLSNSLIIKGILFGAISVLVINFIACSNENHKANNDFFFRDISTEYKYSVIEFLYEDIEEVPVAVKYITSYEKGDVYSISINYDEDCDGRYHWGNLDRFDVGMFYVTDESIYVLLECEDVPTEDDFLTDGDIVYSSDDSETVDEDGYIIDIKNDGDYCLCRIYNPSQGSTFYWNYGWTKGKGLTYFRSGYGAEGDPIEIELKD